MLDSEFIKILSLDPGVTTGVCVGGYTDNVLKLLVDQQQWTVGMLYDYLGGFLADNTERAEPIHVIYEDFSYRNRARAGLDLTPVKLIGIIELYRERYEPFVSFTKQSAAAGKGFFTDEKLKDLNCYTTGKQHGRDATRHLLQWANFGAGSQWIDFPNTKIELVD
jgi:hypothetical protein